MKPAEPFAVTPPTLLTVVIEDYFQVGSFSALIPPSHWERFESRLLRNTEAVLEMLEPGGQRATFFACGWVADHYPEVLRAVVSAGHEVACQGYFQHRVAGLPPAALLEDLRRGKHAIEQAIGRKVSGHRIGQRWLRERELWALELVRDAGFDYDSSLCPLGAEFAAEPGCWVVHPRPLRSGTLIEVPISTTAFAQWRWPVAGGNWFRQAPDAPLRRAEQRWIHQSAAPLVAYFHTWEFDPQQPRIAGASTLQRLRHYRRLERMPERLRQWLAGRRCRSVADHLALAPVAMATARAPSPPVGLPIPLAEPRRRALTVVVPCYNEAESLPYLQRTLQQFVQRSAGSLELSFVFVDDGSRDATWALLQQLAAALPRARLQRHAGNRGIAAALLTGFAASDTDLVAVIDADCTFDPAQLPALVAGLTEDVDVVCASPAHHAGAMKNVPRWRAALSRAAALLYRHVLHQRLSSYTSCFRVYRRDVLQGLALSDGGFSGVAEILGRLDLAGARFAEVPAVLETRVLGRSKIRVLRTMSSHLKLLVRLAACRWLGYRLPTRVTASIAP